MRRIAHLSDLHFGTEPEGLPEACLERLSALGPDLVIVSGDMVQRARDDQFRKARAFLDRLPAPWLCVPGNHDIPLYNAPVRLVAPFSAYRRHIAKRLQPEYRDGVVDVVGVNTVNPYAWQAGSFSRRAWQRVCDSFATAGKRLRIVVMHHPLTHGPKVEKQLMRGAAEALAELSECGADVVLCGHLHSWAAAPSTAREGGREVLLVQSGTTLSTRLRGEENDFNLLTVDGAKLTIERYAAGDDAVFRRASEHVFVREAGRWTFQVQSSTTLPDDPERITEKPSEKSSAFMR